MSWPKPSRKPNAIRVSDKSRKWLWPNTGNFVVTRRFTSKEERRRIVASIYAGDLPGELVGFENHLNVYHAGRSGLPQTLASGLAVYLNSSLVDRYFPAIQWPHPSQCCGPPFASLSEPRHA